MAYDTMWARLIAVPGAADALSAICHEVGKLAAANSRREKCMLRQLVWSTPPSASVTKAPWWEVPFWERRHPEVGGFAVPVRCLDQLFAAAVVAVPLLIGRVQQWALDSRGGFPLRKKMLGSVWLQWADAYNDAMLRRLIRWGPCKSAARAVEKTVRSYNQVCPAYCVRIYYSFQIFTYLEPVVASWPLPLYPQASYHLIVSFCLTGRVTSAGPLQTVHPLFEHSRCCYLSCSHWSRFFCPRHTGHRKHLQ